MRVLILVLAVCLVVIPMNRAWAIEPIVGHVNVPPDGYYAISSTGELFYGWGDDDNSWEYLGRVPDLAGHPASAPFVDITSWSFGFVNCTRSGFCAITANGDVFQKFGENWSFWGNIVESSGRPASGPFCSLDIYHTLCAITDQGELYKFLGAILDGPFGAP